jgi:nucleoside-diphosphate-sugar epimerase
LNVVPAIGVYAAIRREKGEPFSFPGGPSFVWEAADADLVADVMVWAAQSPQAANEAFNITNGDVFEWRNVWPGLAETLGVKTGPDKPTSIAAYLTENGDVGLVPQGAAVSDRPQASAAGREVARLSSMPLLPPFPLPSGMGSIAARELPGWREQTMLQGARRSGSR